MKTAALLFLCCAAVAQQAPQPHYVLVAPSSGPSAAAVLEVDATSGAATQLPPFPSDSLTPLAIVVDPFDGHVLVAVGAPGIGLVVRLANEATGWTEYAVTAVPGRIAGLAFAAGDLFLAVDDATSLGGLYRAARRGGPATQVLAQPNLTAIDGLAPTDARLAIAWTGRTGTPTLDSGLAVFDTANMTMSAGPYAIATPTDLEVTSVFDMPTPAPRFALSFADGRVAHFGSSQSPALNFMPLWPPLPGGSVRRLRDSEGADVDMVALGDAGYPHMIRIDTAFLVTLLTGPLQGTPIDFAYGLPTTARTHRHGVPCGTPLASTAGSMPQLGTTFGLAVQGPPNDLVLLAAGLDDLGLGLLPVALPGGCALHVRPDVALAFVSDNAGVASWLLPVPNLTALLGSAVHAQWLHYAAAGFSTAAAIAIWPGH